MDFLRNHKEFLDSAGGEILFGLGEGYHITVNNSDCIKAVFVRQISVGNHILSNFDL